MRHMIIAAVLVYAACGLLAYMTQLAHFQRKGRLFDLLLVLHSETLAQCWDRHRRGFAA